VQGPKETRALRLMPTLRVNSGTGHCIGFVRDDALWRRLAPVDHSRWS
jgi:hypothetical protein